MISPREIQDIFNNQNPEFLENLAQESRRITQQYFGRTISLYAPLYLSNYCSSHCTYCGFNSHNRIERFKLTHDQIHQEMSSVADKGIENILLLTGESYQAAPLSYLLQAVDIAKEYFTSISLEVHPLDTTQYRQLFRNGVDGITIYQETYDRERYRQVHLSGKKRDYVYRLETPARIAQSGIRQLSMGILIGLSDTAEDLWALYTHLRKMEKESPGIEYSLSFPRLRKIKQQEITPPANIGGKAPGQDKNMMDGVDDITFIKIICLTRILFPRVGINLSTREKPRLRDHALELGVTRISAGSNTSVGGYHIRPPGQQDPQFDIEDTRSVKEVIRHLKKKNFDPVLTDWRPIGNAG